MSLLVRSLRCPHFRGCNVQCRVCVGAANSVKVSSFQGVLVSGCPRFRVSSFQGALISGCPHFRVSPFQGVPTTQRLIHYMYLLHSPGPHYEGAGDEAPQSLGI